MTNAERYGYLHRMTDEEDDAILHTYYDLAKATVLNRAFPFGTDLTEVPERYEAVTLEIACYLINKRGAEGQVSHSENGIARTYESADVPKSLLSKIMPTVGTIK